MFVSGWGYLDQFSFHEFIAKAVIRHCQQLVGSDGSCKDRAHSVLTLRFRKKLRAGRPRSQLQIFLNLSYNLPNLEWAALNFRERNRVNQIPRADHRAELAEIHLRHDHSFESGKHFTEILRERIQMAQMGA